MIQPKDFGIETEPTNVEPSAITSGRGVPGIGEKEGGEKIDPKKLFAEQKSKLGQNIFKLRDKLIERAVDDVLLERTQRGAFFQDKAAFRQNLIDEAKRRAIGKEADDVLAETERYLSSQLGVPLENIGKYPEYAELARVASEHKQLRFSPEGQGIAAEIGGADAANLVDSMKRDEAALQKAGDERAKAVGLADQQRLDAQIDTLKKSVEEKKAKLTPNQLANMPKPVDARFSGAGMDGKAVNVPHGINVFKALKNVTGSDDKTAEMAHRLWRGSLDFGDFNLDDEDDFGTGIRKFVEATGPEGAAAFYGRMLQTFGGGPGGGVMQLAGQALEQGAKPKDPMQENQRQQDATQAMMRQKLKELREADPMRTTGGVLLYVLMSMLLGPGIATVILSNRAKTGELQDDLAMLKMKLKGLDDRRAMLERQKARQQEFRQQSARDEARFDRQLTRDQMRAAEQHRQLVLKAAMLKEKGEKNPIFDKMMSLYNAALRKSQALSSAMDYDGAKAALANADWYFQKANEAVAGDLEAEGE